MEIDSGASVHGNKCPDGLSLARKISILDAISILFDSWSEVSIQTICNFFIKSFKKNESIEDNDFEIKEIPTLFESNELYNQYLAIDDQLATEEELKDKDIINEMNSEKVENNLILEEEEFTNDMENPSNAEVFHALNTLKRYLFCKEISTKDLYKLEKKICLN